MPMPFFDRLRAYYLKVAEVLRGQAEAAAIFPNKTDTGAAREGVYADFLRQHAPSRCNVFFGGFLFGADGSESGQLDVIVTTDTTPRFNFHNTGKSFAPVEGTLAVASIKSTLNKNELEDCLQGFAAMPAARALEGRINPMIANMSCDDWPEKIIFAHDGINGATLLEHLRSFYEKHSHIPLGRRPNIIHVAGKYIIIRLPHGMQMWDPDKGVSTSADPETYHLITSDPDLQGILAVLDALQAKATLSTHILFEYRYLISGVNKAPRPKTT